jgi:hypothetical protein
VIDLQLLICIKVLNAALERAVKDELISHIGKKKPRLVAAAGAGVS